MHNTSNLQKELLAMSVAAAAQLNAAKEVEAQPTKSRKNKNPSRSTYPNNKQSPQQYQPSLSGYGQQSKLNDGLPPYGANSSLLGVRLPPDTEIIKYTSGSKKSCKSLSVPDLDH